MNIQLGLRTLALVGLVMASTFVLVRHELAGAKPAATAPALASMLAVGQH
jgi:hypothetical protein